jgi:two-component system OmpR family sensor kinase/two-component system sensor histidine kinase BaeS
MMNYSNHSEKPDYESQRSGISQHRGEWAHRPWKSDAHQRDYRAKRRTLFGRFMVFLVFLALPLVGLGILFGTLISTAENPPVRFQMVLTFICGLPLIVTLIIGTIGALVFRNLGTPLAKIMSAADAVAEGDLSTRLEESGPGEFRRMARSFNRMTAELERADQQRRNLTADIAHELRTPLHILQGDLEGLQDGVYQPSPEHIQAMLDETQMLARLVDDLQTLSLAEAGQLHLRLEPLDISELLADVATSFSGQMEAAGIILDVKTVGTPQDLTINADPERLDQVLSNLVANALRHTSQDGTIMLTAESTSEGVRILVRDTGEGISSEDLPYIFDRFWRGDKSRQRKSGAGSGLGLAIAKQIIAAHGGQIAVESQLGIGTSFTIELPQNIPLP